MNQETRFELRNCKSCNGEMEVIEKSLNKDSGLCFRCSSREKLKAYFISQETKPLIVTPFDERIGTPCEKCKKPLVAEDFFVEGLEDTKFCNFCSRILKMKNAFAKENKAVEKPIVKVEVLVKKGFFERLLNKLRWVK